MHTVYIVINIDSYKYMIYVYSVTCIYTQKDPKGGFIHQVCRANFEPLQILRPSVPRPPDWCPILRRPAQIHAASDRCFGGEYPEAAIRLVYRGHFKKWSLGIWKVFRDRQIILSHYLHKSAELIRGSADPGKAVPKWQYQLLSLKAFEGVGCGAWLPKKRVGSGKPRNCIHLKVGTKRNSPK